MRRASDAPRCTTASKSNGPWPRPRRQGSSNIPSSRLSNGRLVCLLDPRVVQPIQRHLALLLLPSTASSLSVYPRPQGKLGGLWVNVPTGARSCEGSRCSRFPGWSSRLVQLVVSSRRAGEGGRNPQSAISRAGLLLGRAYMERLARGKALRRRGGGGARKKHGTDVGGGMCAKGLQRIARAGRRADGEDPAGCRPSGRLGSVLEVVNLENDTGHQVGQGQAWWLQAARLQVQQQEQQQ